MSVLVARAPSLAERTVLAAEAASALAAPGVAFDSTPAHTLLVGFAPAAAFAETQWLTAFAAARSSLPAVVLAEVGSFAMTLAAVVP